MAKFVAQRGDFCLLTVEGYQATMEHRHFLPVTMAGWAPENDNVVGYIEGETVYRLVDECAWLEMMQKYRQRTLNNVIGDLKQRGRHEADPGEADWN